MKVWFVGRRTGIILGVIAAAFFALVMLGYFKGGNAAITAASGDRDLPIYCVQKDENDKKLSISFDAACPACRLLKLFNHVFEFK